MNGLPDMKRGGVRLWRAGRRQAHIWVLTIVVAALVALAGPKVRADEAETDGSGQMLYNGIVLPEAWPPDGADRKSTEPMDVPYLRVPPAVIPIDVGRQLFVDDFLIEQTTMERRFHLAKEYKHNPVLKPETKLELATGHLPVAAVFSDGVFYDPNDCLFKMWYHAGWFTGTSYATSKDGLHWDRPSLDVAFLSRGVLVVPHTNQIMPTRFLEGIFRDGVSIWLDHEVQDPAQRFKMLIFNREYQGPTRSEIRISPDGVHWSEPMKTSIDAGGDRSTFFYNPFRRKWVYSIRSYIDSGYGRCRDYREHDDFVNGSRWEPGEAVYWTRADRLDPPDAEIGDQPELYNLDATPYESLMLGVFTIHKGPKNSVCQEGKFPKLTELSLGFSRDGFHWHRPDRRAFIAATRKEGDWNRAYLHSAGGVCLVAGDKLLFYHSGWSGESPVRGGDMYAGGSTGVAFLRRDGFASMDAGDGVETLTTRPVAFKGRHLFVNVDAEQGELKVEVLDQLGGSIEPFTLANSVPISADETLQPVRWRGGDDLSSLAGKPVRFRFHLRQGGLYSFWVSPSESGASHGYVAAGGPGVPGAIDTVGRGAYRDAAAVASAVRAE